MKLSFKHKLLSGLLAAFLLGTASPAFAVPTLQMLPASTTTPIGSSFSVDVVVSGISDLYAFQFDLGFDPTVMQATASSEGPFLQSGGTTFFMPGAIDNTNGVVSFVADTI